MRSKITPVIRLSLLMRDSLMADDHGPFKTPLSH